MCGIAGFIGAELGEDAALGVLGDMAAAMSRRGPDDEGRYFDVSANVGLCHRRLSIIDLSPSGHQPMTSPSGRFVIVFNGEIYNFEQLRSELAAAGCVFRGTSDTEVLLNAFERWGIHGALRRAVGMFALAVWDSGSRTLYLARDRIGEKPLNIVRLARGFAFASDLSAVRASGLADLSVDRTALAMFLKYAYVPAPHAIFAGSSKVLPGAVVAIRTAGAAADDDGDWETLDRAGKLELAQSTYWQPPQAPAANESAGSATDAELQAEFEQLLGDAVRMQLRADVPVGAFLSGGIDSSLICAVAQNLSANSIQTFTMGFEDALFDESKQAAAVASHLGTAHECVTVSARDVMDIVPRIPEIYDEPFADPSQLPTYLVSGIARRKVTVCLTGDAGDELFGGYNRYSDPVRINAKLGHLPAPAKRLLAGMLRAVPAGATDSAVAAVSRLVGSHSLRVQSPGRKLHKLADMLTTQEPRAVYEELMSHWQVPSDILLDAPEDPTLFGPEPWSWPSYFERAMRWDLAHYLPDNNLAKVDRASMAHSLETRLPLLDHRIVEFALRAPMRLKIQGGVGKLVMRKALARYLPRELIERPKMGFSVPIAAWLRGPLRKWAEDLLSAATIRNIGLFDVASVRKRWTEHQTGRNDHYMKLWLVIVAHAWMLHQRRR